MANDDQFAWLDILLREGDTEMEMVWAPIVGEAEYAIQRAAADQPETAASGQSRIIIEAAERFARPAFAWGEEVRAQLAASDQLHTYIVDLSHFVGGYITVRLNENGAAQLESSFDAPEQLSVGIMVRDTGELLDLITDGQITDLIAVGRPLASINFSIDLKDHEWNELIVVAYE